MLRSTDLTNGYDDDTTSDDYDEDTSTSEDSSDTDESITDDEQDIDTCDVLMDWKNGESMTFMESYYRPPVARKWYCAPHGINECDYIKSHVQPWMNTRGSTLNWDELTPYECFMLQIPPLELERWSSVTSMNFLQSMRTPTSVKQIKIIIGVLLASTQGPKKGGVGALFESSTDGLFSGCNLQRFGMGMKRFWEVWSALSVDRKPLDADGDDPYWPINGLINRYNAHYASKYFCGPKVVADETMWWHYCHRLPKTQKVGRNPCDTGSEIKH